MPEKNIRTELIKELKEAVSEKDVPRAMPYEEKPVSNKDNIKIHPEVDKLIKRFKVDIDLDRTKFCKPNFMPFNNPRINDEIVMTPKEYFHSSNDYNHAIIHELTHKICRERGISKELVEIQKLNRETNGLPLDVIKHNIASKDPIWKGDKGLEITSKHFAATVAKDEMIVEQTAIRLMDKVGIKPREEDRAVLKYYLHNQNKLLEKCGQSFINDPKALNAYIVKADKAIKTAEREFDRALGKESDKPKTPKRDKENTK